MEFGYLVLYGSGGVIMRRLRVRSRMKRPYLSNQESIDLSFSCTSIPPTVDRILQYNLSESS